MDLIFRLIYVIPVVIISIVLHENAHAYVALWNGDYTAKAQGRITLNPIKHFDPLGFLMLVFVGFGYAKPVPVNPNNFRKIRRGIFTVSIAGVSVNLSLAFFSMPLYLLFCYYIPFDPAATFFFYMISINLGLTLFNLLPIYPLDGFRVVESFTYHTNKFCWFMRNHGFIILAVLLLIDFGIGILTSNGFATWLNYFNIFYWMGEAVYYIMLGFEKVWMFVMRI